MLADFKVNRCSRKCYAQSRPLRDGEWFYSVVLENDEDLIRRDYSAESWSGPPEGAVGWWKGRMPLAGARKLVLAPDAVLVDLLRGLGDLPQQQALRYLLALMLLRRRVVSLVPKQEHYGHLGSGSVKLASQSNLRGIDASPTSPETMQLRVAADGSEIEVAACAISPRQIETLEVALQELLYCEAPE